MGAVGGRSGYWGKGLCGHFLALLLLSIQSPSAFAFEHLLAEGKSAIFRPGSSLSGRIAFSDENIPSTMSDPRCPAVSSLRIATAPDRIETLDLSCDRWTKTKRGYRYTDALGTAVRSVVISDRRMKVRLGHFSVSTLTGPLSFAEVGLRVGEDTHCGRFAVPTVSTAELTRFVGPTEQCRLPLPNFVVLVLDDARFDGLDQMPILAEIASAGVMFDNAFSPNAVCGPARASILTGLYSLRHRMFHIAGPIGGVRRFRESGMDQQALPVWLQNAGYRTGLFGKYNNAYNLTEETAGPGGSFYVPPGWDRWWAMKSAEHYGGVLGQTYHIVDENGGVTTYSDHTTDAEYSTDLSAEKLRSFVAESVDAGRPFFAYWAPYAPHGEWPTVLAAAAERHFGTFASLPPWRPASYHEADVSDKPRWMNRVRARMLDPMFGPVLAEVGDLFRISQYESLLSVDEQLGLIREHLASLRVDQDTFLLVVSDQGFTWGEHSLYGKEDPYEETQRIPMIVYYPRRFGPGPRHVDAAVLHLDIAPTIAALAEASPVFETDGQDLRPLLEGSPDPSWRTDYLLERWRATRGDDLTYKGQVADGDRIRLFHGNPRANPRASLEFEFDTGDGVSSGAVAVQVGATAAETFAALRDSIAAQFPQAGVTHSIATKKVSVSLGSADETESVVFWEEIDLLGSIAPNDVMPDYFGVRDVANGFTWVEYETGERELYDLNVDPSQLENRADDPAYASIRLQLEQRLEELLGEIESRSP